MEKVDYNSIRTSIEIRDYIDGISGEYPIIYRLKCSFLPELFVGILEDNYYEFEVVNGIKNGEFSSQYPSGQKRTKEIHKNGYELKKESGCPTVSLYMSLMGKIDRKELLCNR